MTSRICFGKPDIRKFKKACVSLGAGYNNTSLHMRIISMLYAIVYAVRKLQVAILDRSSREMSQTVRID